MSKDSKKLAALKGLVDLGLSEAEAERIVEAVVSSAVAFDTPVETAIANWIRSNKEYEKSNAETKGFLISL